MTHRTNQENSPTDQKSYSTARPALTSLSAENLAVPSPQTVPSYALQIFQNLLETQRNYIPDPHYIQNHQEINHKMRAVLVDWTVNVHWKLKLSTETLFLTVNLIDRYLEKRSVNRKQLQLVGICSLFVAAKYEEIYPPTTSEMLYLADKAYTKQHLLKMEVDMLNALEFNMSGPSTWRFFERLCDLSKLKGKKRSLGHYLLELSLVEYFMLRYRPSVQAVAATFIAHKMFDKDFVWAGTEELFHREDEFRDCAKEMLVILHSVKIHPLTAVKDKFERPVHHKISTEDYLI